MNERFQNAELHADRDLMPREPKKQATAEDYAHAVACILQELLKDSVTHIQQITDEEGKTFILHRRNDEQEISIRQHCDGFLITGLTNRTKRLLSKRLQAIGHFDQW